MTTPTDLDTSSGASGADDRHAATAALLRTTFRRAAAAAPLATPEPPALPFVRVTAPRGRATIRIAASSPVRRGLVVGAAAAACAAGITGVVALARHAEPPQRTPVFAPTGTEVPLTPAALPDDFTTTVVGGSIAAIEPDSIVAVAVADHPTIVRYRTVFYEAGTVVETTCTGSNGSAGCQADWNASAPDLTWTSSVDNHDAAFNLRLWANVPADVAYVTWQSPAGPLWQRPVSGIVAFPYVDGDTTAPLVALGVDGAVLDSVDDDVYDERLGTPPEGWRTDPAYPGWYSIDLVDNLSSGQRGELSDLAAATVATCMTQPGAVWDTCVGEATAAVEARFAELGGEMVPYDPEPRADGSTADGSVGPYLLPGPVGGTPADTPAGTATATATTASPTPATTSAPATTSTPG